MMNYPSQPKLSPEFTPTWIKRLLYLTIGLSLLASLLDPLILSHFKVRTLYEYLTLSPLSIHRYYFWQPFTYFFIDSTTRGISLFYLIQLTFHMYLLWALGTSVYEYTGKGSFLRFYLLTGVAIGFATILLFNITGSYGVLAGNAGPLFALAVFWIMLYPETELSLFFTFIVPARWVIFATVLGSLLINLSNGHFITLCSHMLGVGIGYFYAVALWDLRSPFDQTHDFDTALSRWTHTLRQRKTFAHHSLKEIYKDVKIFDFQTGKAKLTDDEFLDLMLSKISMHGEKSLSWEERKRMHKISEKRNQELEEVEEGED